MINCLLLGRYEIRHLCAIGGRGELRMKDVVADGVKGSTEVKVVKNQEAQVRSRVDNL